LLEVSWPLLQKGLPGSFAIPILKNLIKNHDDSNDPDIPLLIWWAMEVKIRVRQAGCTVSIFEDKGYLAEKSWCRMSC
jgi:hypothetical protein